MEYKALSEILTDPDLDLGLSADATTTQIKRRVTAKLKNPTPTAARQKTVQYQKLVAARSALNHPLPAKVTTPTAVEQWSPGQLVQLGEVLKNITNVGPTREDLARARRADAATKATKDFRNARRVPALSFGAIAAALWGSRTVFGANFSHIGTTWWAAGALVALAAAAAFLGVSSSAQRADEQALGRMYDEEVQAAALQKVGSGLSRSEYRRSLLAAARERYRPTYFRRLGGALSTVDLNAAVEDASDLALARLVSMDLLESGASEYGVTVYAQTRPPEPA